MLSVSATPSFVRVAKKLHPKDKKVLDEAVQTVLESPQGEKSSDSRSTLSISSEVSIFACIHALADASLLFGTCPNPSRLLSLLNTNSTCQRFR